MTAEATNEMEVPPYLTEEPCCTRSIDLVALPSAVTIARLFVSSTLNHWKARFIETDAELVAAELVKHSVSSSAPGSNWHHGHRLDYIVLRLVGYEQAIVLEVWDVFPDLPAQQDEEAVGLALVGARAKRWGSNPTKWGRMRWAEFDVPSNW